MKMTQTLGLGIAACALAALWAAPATLADPPGKHDSNTLHKLGKAIQYPINKAAQNASVDAHRATGTKSVMHRRNGNKTYRTVITPKGNIHRKYRVGHRHHRHM